MTDPAQEHNSKAITHGITSASPVIEGMEDQQDWERHLGGIVESLSPEGSLEQTLAERVASLFWRLQRVTRHETATIRHVIQGIEGTVMNANRYIETHPEEGYKLIDTSLVIHDQERHLVLAPHALDKIMRYESHLHRQCLQTLHELEAMQARRLGQQTPLARLDISAPPATYLAAARKT